MTTLILAEHDNKTLKPVTLHVVTAAAKLGQPVTLLVAGKDCAGVAQQGAAIAGVSEVLHADDAAYANFLAENMAALIAKLAGGYSHILAPATSFGKNILPRAAGLCDCAQISDIMAIESADTFVRPIYAGNAIATVQSKDKIKFITVRGTAFDAAAATGGTASVKKIDAAGESGLSSFVGAELSKSERPELTAARIVVSGGRGVGSGENFKTVIEPLADKLGAAVGASRAAVDAGYVPNDYQVGQTGKVVAPDLYIAIGISGAIQHLAGMKSSKTIVAINKDPDAPIFAVADYGLVADLFVAVPELIKALG
ncbi:MAG: FAD-binding protein [Alphaproteobacteria bacterium]|nr:FAD-binding protein [Alphaproteobacteria bacterium]